MGYEKKIAGLPLVARALKGDVVILRKCPWGAMTDRIMAQYLGSEGESLDYW